MTKPPLDDLDVTVSGYLFMGSLVMAIGGLIADSTNILLFSIVLSIQALGIRT